MIITFLLFGFGCYLLLKVATRKKKVVISAPKTEGEVLGNKYIIEHEKKMKYDIAYDEYLEWCKLKGEIPVEKQGFDEHRMKEFQMYKKLLKHGIGGL